MVRQKSIFCKLNSILKSDKEIFDAAIKAFLMCKTICPSCGAKGCCREHDNYYRLLITIEFGKRKKHYIEIPRIFCESCGTTHAILPDVLIPYRSYSLRFILFILAQYLQRDCTVEVFCEHWDIAIATLYSWKDIFLEHASLWLGKLAEASVLCEKTINHIRESEKSTHDFFEKYKFSFMQYMKTTRCNNTS